MSGTRPPRPSRAVGLAAAAIGVLATACGGSGGDGRAAVTTTTVAPTTTSLGEPVVLGTAPALELAEGQCYLSLADAGEATTTTASTSPGHVALAVVQVVDCGADHTGRVYASFCLVPDADGDLVAGGCPGDPATAWPGDRDLRRAAVRGCLARFEPVFGEPYADSEHTSLELTPDAPAWSVGHRRVVCAIEP